jgi:hypothetical protein
MIARRVTRILIAVALVFLPYLLVKPDGRIRLQRPHSIFVDPNIDLTPNYVLRFNAAYFPRDRHIPRAIR